MNQRKIGTILSYLQIILSNTISIFYTPYMLRTMGQSEYGLFGTATSFIGYLSILNFGIGGAYIRFNARCRAAGDREEESRLNGMFLAVFSFLALLVLICGLGCILLAERLVDGTFTPQEIRKLRIILFILILNTMATFVFNVVMMALIAYEKFVMVRMTTLAASVLTPIANVAALHMGGRSITITAISTVISIVCFMLYLIYARKTIDLHFTFKNFDRGLLKEIFAFSGFLFLNSITDQITFSTDNIILGATIGTSAVAVYTVGANFKNYFQQFSTTVSNVFAPQINMIVARGKKTTELDDLFVRIGRVQFYIISLIMIGYLSLGQDFVCMWAGADYREAFYIGLLLMISVCIPSFQNVGIEIQKAMNMHRARSIVYFFIALGNIALTIPFSRLWGGVGAALATALCMVLGYSVFMNWHYARRIGLDIGRFWRSIASILPGYIVPAIAAWLIHRYWEMTSFLDILAAAVVITAVFLVCVWKFSMNEYERNLAMVPLRKLSGAIRGKKRAE